MKNPYLLSKTKLNKYIENLIERKKEYVAQKLKIYAFEFNKRDSM